MFEAHPEVTFAALTGRALAPKKTARGRAARRHVLSGLGFDLDRLGAGLGPRARLWAFDHLCDACVLCWTAARIAAHAQATLPDPAARDRRGHRMAIHV